VNRTEKEQELIEVDFTQPIRLLVGNPKLDGRYNFYGSANLPFIPSVGSVIEVLNEELSCVQTIRIRALRHKADGGVVATVEPRYFFNDAASTIDSEEDLKLALRKLISIGLRSRWTTAEDIASRGENLRKLKPYIKPKEIVSIEESTACPVDVTFGLSTPFILNSESKKFRRSVVYLSSPMELHFQHVSKLPFPPAVGIQYSNEAWSSGAIAIVRFDVPTGNWFAGTQWHTDPIKLESDQEVDDTIRSMQRSGWHLVLISGVEPIEDDK